MARPTEIHTRRIPGWGGIVKLYAHGPKPWTMFTVVLESPTGTAIQTWTRIDGREASLRFGHTFAPSNAINVYREKV